MRIRLLLRLQWRVLVIPVVPLLPGDSDLGKQCFGCTVADVLPLCQNPLLIFQVKLQSNGELNSIVKQGL